ncbi:AP2 domain-containing protein [Burkholderia aenigmatica]|uniref:AP2 domain-containing protein n=1 Tax=Burkholderia aenigmatica TaxID=2015348 RepID=UPI0015827332|nr:AP2 domain-containing protein [Burkholderia aenigmatica]
MKEIALSRGLVALVDDEDYEVVSRYKWTATTNQYAYRTESDDGRQVGFAMHREIMGLSPDDPRDVDHRDGNTLNNQRKNLRVCTHAQNTCNRKMSRRNTSGYKGVTWSKRDQRWQAQIMIGGKQKWLGLFDAPETAHQAYRRAAVELHGEFANYGAN